MTTSIADARVNQPFTTLDADGSPLVANKIYTHPTLGRIKVLRELRVNTGANWRPYCRVYYRRAGAFFISQKIKGEYQSLLISN